MRIRAMVVLASALALTGGAARADLTDGLKAYWQLNGNGLDAVGEAHLTSTSGITSYSSDDPIEGQCAVGQENASANTAIYGTPGTALEIWKEVTISTWYRVDSVGGGGEKSAFYLNPRTLGWYNPDNNQTFYFIVDFYDGSSYRTWSSGELSLAQALGDWYHVVQVVRSDGQHEAWSANRADADHGSPDSTLLIDAEYLGIDTSTLPTDSLMTAYYEAKGGAGGRVAADELAVWNRALSAAEIEELFDLGAAGQTMPLPDRSALFYIL